MMATSKEGDDLRKSCTDMFSDDWEKIDRKQEDPEELKMLGVDPRQAHINRYVHCLVKLDGLGLGDVGKVVYLAFYFLASLMIRAAGGADKAKQPSSQQGGCCSGHGEEDDEHWSVTRSYCQGCDKRGEGMKACGRCRKAYYCSHDCQKVRL